MATNVILDNVKKYAAKEGLSIRAVEMKAGLANGTIGKWAKTDAKASSLIAVASALNVNIDKLVEE